MNKLTKEQKNSIINEYGASNIIIESIEEILSVYNFTEEQYIYLVSEIVSEWQTNNLEKEQGKIEMYTYKSIAEIILKVVKYKLKDELESKNYNDNLLEIMEDMQNETKKR